MSEYAIPLPTAERRLLKAPNLSRVGSLAIEAVKTKSADKEARHKVEFRASQEAQASAVGIITPLLEYYLSHRAKESASGITASRNAGGREAVLKYVKESPIVSSKGKTVEQDPNYGLWELSVQGEVPQKYAFKLFKPESKIPPEFKIFGQKGKVQEVNLLQYAEQEKIYRQISEVLTWMASGIKDHELKIHDLQPPVISEAPTNNIRNMPTRSQNQAEHKSVAVAA